MVYDRRSIGKVSSSQATPEKLYSANGAQQDTNDDVKNLFI